MPAFTSWAFTIDRRCMLYAWKVAFMADVYVQEKRKKPDPPKPPNGQMSPIQEESVSGHTAAEEEQHGDATLARTGRC